MKSIIVLLSVSLSLVMLSMAEAKESPARPTDVRRLPVKEYLDKMKAGWLGQMAGVGFGAPTEFRWNGATIPEDKMPVWKPELINQYNQDDIYVEMTFLRTLEVRGLNASIRQAGIDFARSGYPLWHANEDGRSNLRRGIAPPDSGHPQFNKHADDIDYQIEADFSGLIAPGMPNVAIELGETFGRLMNYGDGLYGGQFVGGLYAEAFFESNPVKLVEAGLACIPAGSQYHECISDVVKWWKENPDDWQKTWKLVEDKYNLNDAYRRASCTKVHSGKGGVFNIDAKINGAYIVMGLLYGKGDPDLTIGVATRCGQDSDCNPSSAAGVLFTTLGFSKLPEKFVSAINLETLFSHTPYDLPTVLEVCEKLARQAVVKAGGTIGKDAAGNEFFVIPVKVPGPGKLEQCWDATKPATGARFTAEEMAEITARTGVIDKDFDRFAPGWKISGCGPGKGHSQQPTERGPRNRWKGKMHIFVTNPSLDKKTPCVLSKSVDVPAGRTTRLKFAVSHYPATEWVLVVKADGKELLTRTISDETSPDGWVDMVVDLSSFAGKPVNLELENRPGKTKVDGAYWADLAVVSE